MKRSILFAFITAGVFIMAAMASCKKDNPEAPSVTAISLSQDTVKINMGDTRTISVTLTPSSYDKTKLVWHSSDNSIVTVDNTGKLTGLKQGNAIITVTNTDATVTSVCLVSVLPTLKGIALTKDTVAMNSGDIKTLNITTTPLNSDKSTLVWKSSDTTIVSVSSAGVITGRKVGSAIISVKNQDGTLTTFCLVVVGPMVDPLAAGLIAYYPFNNSGLDMSGNGNNGTLYNISSVPDRHGNQNSAYHFDGFTSYISVPNKSQLTLNNTDYTLSAWVSIDSYNSSFGFNILTKHYTGNDNGWAWGITGTGYTTTGIVTYGTGGTSASARGNRIIGLNQWHMVTVVYKNSTQTVSIYVDGVLDNITNAFPTPNPAINAMLYIGRDDPSVPSNGYFLHGALDDVRIYNRALSQNDINALYTFAN